MAALLATGMAPSLLRVPERSLARLGGTSYNPAPTGLQRPDCAALPELAPGMIHVRSTYVQNPAPSRNHSIGHKTGRQGWLGARHGSHRGFHHTSRTGPFLFLFHPYGSKTHYG